VHIDLEHRAELLRQQPDIYYITDHYAPHSTVLVRLSKITRTDLKEFLRDACRFVSSSASKGRTSEETSEAATPPIGCAKETLNRPIGRRMTLCCVPQGRLRARGGASADLPVALPKSR